LVLAVRCVRCWLFVRSCVRSFVRSCLGGWVGACPRPRPRPSGLVLHGAWHPLASARLRSLASVLGAGCWPRCWVLGAGLGAGCWVLGAGCWVLGASAWIGAGCWCKKISPLFRRGWNGYWSTCCMGLGGIALGCICMPVGLSPFLSSLGIGLVVRSLSLRIGCVRSQIPLARFR